MEKIGLDYPLYIRSPRKINITAEQFNKLSYMGLASLFCSFKYVIEKNEDDYKIYMREGYHWLLKENPRFKGLEIGVYESAEMGLVIVPIDNPLIKTIEKYFSHLIMK
jgi:hypothetical protein